MAHPVTLGFWLSGGTSRTGFFWVRAGCRAGIGQDVRQRPRSAEVWPKQEYIKLHDFDRCGSALNIGNHSTSVVLARELFHPSVQLCGSLVQSRENPGLALVLHLARGTRPICRTAPICFSKPRTPLEDAFVYKCEQRLAVSLAAAHASVSTSADKTKKHRVMAHISSRSLPNGYGIERCELGLRTR